MENDAKAKGKGQQFLKSFQSPTNAYKKETHCKINKTKLLLVLLTTPPSSPLALAASNSLGKNILCNNIILAIK